MELEHTVQKKIVKIELSDKNILVTGGAGFIGSNLCEKLLSLGNKVYCFDNLSTGKKINIEEFLKNDKFRFIKGDIRSLEDCKKPQKILILFYIKLRLVLFQGQ